MIAPRIARTRPLSRRTVLRASGAALSLPLLDAMVPRRSTAGMRSEAAPPRRFVAINTSMGLLPRYFAPEKGESPYLKLLGRHRGTGSRR